MLTDHLGVPKSPRGDFAGQVVLVTGASSGIGAAICRGFGGLGAHVAVHFNQSASLATELVDALKGSGQTASAYQADLTIPDSASALIREVLADYGRLDVLVNNAGAMVRRALVSEANTRLYDQVMDVNFRHVVDASRAAVPHLEESVGTIVNISSIAARTGGGPGSSLYAAAKAAVATYTRALARELAPKGIRVNSVSPGLVESPFHEGVTSDGQFRDLAEQIPMGRVGQPEDCVGPTLFLANSAWSGFVTGQVLEVNGGQLSP